MLEKYRQNNERQLHRISSAISTLSLSIIPHQEFAQIQIIYSVSRTNKLQRDDDQPEKYERQHLFRLYYEEGTEIDDIVSDAS